MNCIFTFFALDFDLGFTGFTGVKVYDDDLVFDPKFLANLLFLICDETISATRIKHWSFFSELSSWKNILRARLTPAYALFYVHPDTKVESEVSLSVDAIDTMNLDDQKKYRYLLFAVDKAKAEGFEEVTIGVHEFKVTPIHTACKFIVRSKVAGNSSNTSIESPSGIQVKPIVNSFKAPWNDLKLNAVEFIVASAFVYSWIYKEMPKFYAPISCLCQCSGSGKSKSCTTATKDTPGFYVCLRDGDPAKFAFPKSNCISQALMDIFSSKNLIVDTLDDQSALDSNLCTVGLCLLFIAQCIRSYYVHIISNLAKSLKDGISLEECDALLKKELANFSAVFFESDSGKIVVEESTEVASTAPNTTTENQVKQFKFCSRKSISKRILSANAKSENTSIATVKDVVDYIDFMLSKPEDCFLNDSDLQGITKEALKFACSAMSRMVNSDRPFLFFIDEAGILAKMSDLITILKNNAVEKTVTYSAFQIFRRAISYLTLTTNIFFVALGTKSSIEELSPPVVDSSLRSVQRRDFLPPIVVTQNFDIWRELYPLNEMVPCFNTLLNSCSFKFLLTLGHPIFSSVYFKDVLQLSTIKLLNGTAETEQTYLLAIWMLRAGLACDPKSVVAGSLVENHMATLFNIQAAPSTGRDSVPAFARQSRALYDITYQSTPSLAWGARELCLQSKKEERGIFFKQLDEKLESLLVDRGRLGEAIGCLLTMLAIDTVAVKKNIAKTELNDEFSKKMMALTPMKFHSLWQKKTNLLADDNSLVSSRFLPYKVVTVHAYLEGLLGKEDFAKLRPFLPRIALGGLINATHFVSLSRLSEPLLKDGHGVNPPNANDWVYDKKRNVITYDRLRMCLARQCALIMPANFYAYDAVVPFLLPLELVTSADGKTKTIQRADFDKPNGVPEAVRREEREEDKGKPTYRPIYSYLGIQFKTGKFDDIALTGMQARLHFVTCPVYGSSSVKHCPEHEQGCPTNCTESCPHCEDSLLLQQIFENQISFLYCFKTKDEISATRRNSVSVNYGPIYPSSAPASASTSNYNSSKPAFRDILKELYPETNQQSCLESVERQFSSSFTHQRKDHRTFEDYLVRHKHTISNSLDLVNFAWNESGKLVATSSSSESAQLAARPACHYGLTYRKVDVSKYEDSKSNASAKKRKLDSCDNVTGVANAVRGLSVSGSSVPEPVPVCLEPPFNRARMSSIIIYGWDKWENFIGSEGVERAKKMLDDFELDPVRNVARSDLAYLAPSLKIIMSSKLLGLDHYLDPPGKQDAISYDEWISIVQQKMSSVKSPEVVKGLLSTKKAGQQQEAITSEDERDAIMEDA